MPVPALMCPSRALALLVFAHRGAGSAATVPLAFVQEVACGVTEPVCILVIPDGSGGSFLQARTLGGDVVDATVAVRIWLIDEFGPIGPLAGFEAEYPLPISFNSPDINGDLVIDLTDIALFSQDLHRTSAPLRSDLVWNGVINLSDITVFCQHLGAGCP